MNLKPDDLVLIAKIQRELQTRFPSPKLTIELVPSSLHGRNLHNGQYISDRAWRNLSRRVYRRAGYRCEICGGRGTRHPVECHEVWKYDLTSFDQRLVKLIALCPYCHMVKHIGLTGHKNKMGLAITHLARVNGWTNRQAIHYKDLHLSLVYQYDKIDWGLDLSHLHEYGIQVALPEIELPQPLEVSKTEPQTEIVQLPSTRPDTFVEPSQSIETPELPSLQPQVESVQPPLVPSTSVEPSKLTQLEIEISQASSEPTSLPPAKIFVEPNERLLIKERLHWINLWAASFVALPGFFCLMSGLFMALTSPLAAMDSRQIEIAQAGAVFYTTCGGLILFVALLMALHSLLSHRNFNLYITSNRVVFEKGVLNRYYTELTYDEIDTVTVKQSILGRLLGYGAVILKIGTASEYISPVCNPHKISHRIDTIKILKAMCR